MRYIRSFLQWFHLHVVSVLGFVLFGWGIADATFAQTAIRLSQPLGGVSQVSGLGNYIATAYQYAIGISTIVATVMFIYGGFRYLIGVTSGSVARGKEIMFDSVIGLILVLGAYLILQTVNPATLSLSQLNPTQIRLVPTPGYTTSTTACDLGNNQNCPVGMRCVQPNSHAPGRCFYGDWHDDALIQSGDAITCVESEARRNCAFVSSGEVDQTCVDRRYQCNSQAHCSQDAYNGLFDSTNAYARTHGGANFHYGQLDASNYFRQNCRKNIGDTCTADNECPSKCVAGHCTGFCALVISTSPPSGAYASVDACPGGVPPYNYTAVACTTDGCGSNTWSFVSMLNDFSEIPDAARQENTYENYLSHIGCFTNNFSMSACWPKRPTGSKCDFPGQCSSDTCNTPDGSIPSVLPTANHPEDTNAGIGTCG